jgi:hypothetical protein
MLRFSTRAPSELGDGNEDSPGIDWLSSCGEGNGLYTDANGKRSIEEGRSLIPQHCCPAPSLNSRIVCCTHIFLCLLPFSSSPIQQLLRLIDLPRQIRAPPTIRMIQQHHLPMPLPQLLPRHISSTPILNLQNQLCFSFRHLVLKSPLVERLAKRVECRWVFVAAEGDETGAREEGGCGDAEAKGDGGGCHASG